MSLFFLRPPATRVSDKVMIPQDEYPEINFVGLLIGPRWVPAVLWNTEFPRIWEELPGWLGVKESACWCNKHGSIPGLGRSPEGGNSNALQCSCLENPMDRGAWWATVHGGHKRVRRNLVTEHSCKDLGDESVLCLSGYHLPAFGRMFTLAEWVPFGEKIFRFTAEKSNLEDCCDLNLKIVELLVGKSHSIHSRFPITAQWATLNFHVGY